MGQHWRSLMFCTGLWTAAFALLIYATLREDFMAAAWGIIAAMGGCLVAGWIMVTKVAVQERVRVEEIATIAALEVARDSSSTVQPIR